jgi:hypothetical protein
MAKKKQKTIPHVDLQNITQKIEQHEHHLKHGWTLNLKIVNVHHIIGIKCERVQDCYFLSNT